MTAFRSTTPGGLRGALALGLAATLLSAEHEAGADRVPAAERRTAVPMVGLQVGAVPPASPPADLVSDLVDLAEWDPRLRLDLRYATTNNFMGEVLYPVARAWLQRPAAEALRRAHDRLLREGYGLVVLDAYRPWEVTRQMWERFPQDRAYLADPAQGSRHNRGAAVDVTLCHPASGTEIRMPSGFDDFSERAHPDYAGGTAEQRAARDRLRAAMEAEGFRVYASEWWHFDYQGWQRYPVLNEPLDRLEPAHKPSRERPEGTVLEIRRGALRDAFDAAAIDELGAPGVQAGPGGNIRALRPAAIQRQRRVAGRLGVEEGLVLSESPGLP